MDVPGQVVGDQARQPDAQVDQHVRLHLLGDPAGDDFLGRPSESSLQQVGHQNARGLDRTGEITPTGTIICGSAITTSAASARMGSIGRIYSLAIRTQPLRAKSVTKKWHDKPELKAIYELVLVSLPLFRYRLAHARSRRPDACPRRRSARVHRLRADQRRPLSQGAIGRVDGVHRRGAPDRAPRVATALWSCAVRRRRAQARSGGDLGADEGLR